MLYYLMYKTIRAVQYNFVLSNISDIFNKLFSKICRHFIAVLDKNIGINNVFNSVLGQLYESIFNLFKNRMKDFLLEFIAI